MDKYNEDNALDISVYKGPTDHVYIEQNNISLYLGRRVRLESIEYFPKQATEQPYNTAYAKGDITLL